MASITINGVTIDPAAPPPAAVLGLADAATDPDGAAASDHILIQTAAPLTTAERAELAGLGATIDEYAADDTYLATFAPADLAPVRALPFVTWAGVYPPVFKVAPALLPPPAPLGDFAPMAVVGAASATSRRPRTVDIVFHDGVDTADPELRAAVAAAARVDADTLPTGRRKVRLTVQEHDLADLAAIDAVRVIQPAPERRLLNNVARTILNAHVVVGATTYEGAGQVVAVADTGFDKGSTTAPHPAFTGRVDKLYALGRPDKVDDPDGHGTHVCGSVLGDGTSATMGGAIRGTAPKAHLVLQSLLSPDGGLGGIPVDLNDLFEPPFKDDGARVHTNSWGSTTPSLPYDQSAFEIDEFVWDNPELVICFAAGNDGIDADGDGVVDPAQIGSEAAAKNCITVGASESLRPEAQASRPTYGSLRPASFPKNPIRDDGCADDAEGMAAFSSRGPTQERRDKPDVVAPGTSILSTHSRAAAAAKDTFGLSKDPAFFFDSGTSMATPLVAGCAAVVRESLVKSGLPHPTAALVKALLVNGATKLDGQYSPTEAGRSFNPASGWGRVDLAGSVALPGAAAGFGEGAPLEQGADGTFNVTIPAERPAGVGTTTFKVTLVWSDPPGVTLQNDLDLIVVAADGRQHHGNMGARRGFDRVNNVEQVLWEAMPPGPATVTVRAHRITKFPQSYAYAWRIG